MLRLDNRFSCHCHAMTIGPICASIVALALLSTLVIAPSTTYGANWTGSASSDWFDAANWNPFGVPGPMDSAAINVLPGATAASSIGIDSLSVGEGLPGGSFTAMAFGTLTLTAGDLALGSAGSGSFILRVGTASDGGSAGGIVALPAGTLIGHGSGAGGEVSIGRVYGPGSANGRISAGAVDLTNVGIGVGIAYPASQLSVPIGAAIAIGSFSAGSGTILAPGYPTIGQVVGDGSGAVIANASGRLSLGGTLLGGATSPSSPTSDLQIGLAASSPGSSALGSVSVQRVEQFSDVIAGFSYRGGSGSGTLEVGAGGIHGSGTGFLTIGQTVASPTGAMEATGAVKVTGGNVDGFHTLLFDRGEFSVSGGHIQVVGVKHNPWDNSFGDFNVGSFNAVPQQTAKFQLTDGSLDTKVTFVNFAGGQGTLEHSTAYLHDPGVQGPAPFLTIGYGNAPGELILTDSQLVSELPLSLGYAAGLSSVPTSSIELTRSSFDIRNAAYLNSAARLVFSVDGLTRSAQYGALDAETISLDGSLEVVFAYTPGAGKSFFDLIRTQNGGMDGITGSFKSIAVLGLTPGLTWSTEEVGYGTGEAFRLFVTNPVPEPSTWVLMLAGLMMIGTMAYRRTGIAAVRSL